MTGDGRSDRFDRLIIHPRYNGPSTSGNGGWVAGSMARVMAQNVNAQGASGPYSRCFGCGLARSDGLRIVPGPVGNDGMVATSWTPPSLPADAGGQLCVEATWAALDCSAGFAWMQRLGTGTPIITARMISAIDQPLQVGHRYTVIGWPIAQEGRKLHAGTAIFDAAGKVQARSRQLWLIQRV